MPKAVKDIELTSMPLVVDDLHRYDGAFLLLRYHGTQVGKIILPAREGKIVLAQHLDAIHKEIEKRMKFAVVDHFLKEDDVNKKHFHAPATIAICSRNRTEDLKICLPALMKLPQRGQEIIVVDNAPSTEDTKNLVAQYPGIRYVLEPRKGLNIARNRALAEARNDIVVFTDDDAVPDPNWLDALVRNFDEPMVMCVTGMTMPLELETRAQEAFEDYSPFGKGFFKKRYSFSRSNPLAAGGIGAGANMAVRKSLIRDTGAFDEALDAGTVTQSGGDHEFFVRVLLAGYQIIYDPEALSWHRHRRTWNEAVQAIHGYGVGVYAFWTKLFYGLRQFQIVLFAKGWLLHTQLPNFYRSLFGLKKHYPLEFIMAEFKGCLKGPFAYFKSRRKVKQYLKNGAL